MTPLFLVVVMVSVSLVLIAYFFFNRSLAKGLGVAGIVIAVCYQVVSVLRTTPDDKSPAPIMDVHAELSSNHVPLYFGPGSMQQKARDFHLSLRFRNISSVTLTRLTLEVYVQQLWKATDTPSARHFLELQKSLSLVATAAQPYLEPKSVFDSQDIAQRISGQLRAVLFTDNNYSLAYNGPPPTILEPKTADPTAATIKVLDRGPILDFFRDNFPTDIATKFTTFAPYCSGSPFRGYAGIGIHAFLGYQRGEDRVYIYYFGGMFYALTERDRIPGLIPVPYQLFDYLTVFPRALGRRGEASKLRSVPVYDDVSTNDPTYFKDASEDLTTMVANSDEDGDQIPFLAFWFMKDLGVKSLGVCERRGNQGLTGTQTSRSTVPGTGM